LAETPAEKRKVTMIGTVWHYDEVLQGGIIVGQDERRYRFSRKDYLGSNELKEDDTVDFKIEGNWAKEITLLAAASKDT
jgi:hypothetical protein